MVHLACVEMGLPLDVFSEKDDLDYPGEREYVERLYRPAAEHAAVVGANGAKPARELAEWVAGVRAAWEGVQVSHVESGGVDSTPHVGDELHLRAHVALGWLSPDDVSVEVVYGHSHGDDRIDDARVALLEPDGASTTDAATRVYVGTVTLDRAGAFGYTVRVVPRHPLLLSSAELGLVASAN